MAQAMSGVMSVTGYPGGPPVKAGVPVADIGCALFAAYATLAAYIGAKKTGRASTSTRRCSTRRWPSRSGTSPNTGARASAPQPLGTSQQDDARRTRR